MRILLALLFASAAYGQIQVPAESEPYQPIVAKIVTDMPPEATFSGGWKADDATKFIEVPGGRIHIWAKPGSHSLSYVGYWVHTQTVEFKDGDGNLIKIESYLGSGFINEEAGFVVSGDVPTPPDPIDPPPGPDEKYQIVIFLAAEKLEEMPDPQRDLATSLKVRKRLRDLGHKVVQLIDDDQIKEGVPAKWRPWIQSVIGKDLPRVALAPMGGGPIESYPLPDDYDGLLKLLGGGE